jgi:hypothetical protein
MWVALLTTKYAATDAVKHLQAMVEKKSGRKLPSSPSPSLWPTVQRRALSAIIAPPTRRSRTASWRGETRRWSPWRGLC